MDAERDDEIGTRLAGAVAVGDLESATAIVRDSWFHLMVVDGARTLATLDQVPGKRLREYPLLTMLLGIIYNAIAHRRMKAARLFVSAVQAAHSSRRDLDPVDRILILVSEGVAYRLLGHPQIGVKPARRAIVMLESLDDAARDRIHQLANVYVHAGITLYYGGKTFDALDAFETGLGEVSSTGELVGFGNIAMLAGIHALRGELREAETFLKLARGEPWTVEQRSTYAGTFYRLAEAQSGVERFDADVARGHLEAMDHDPRSIEHWLEIATTSALTELVAGRPGVALAGLEEYVTARGREARAAGPKSRLASIRALLQLALGNPEAAEAILNRDGVGDAQSYVDKARVELVRGRNGAALANLRMIAGEEQSPRTMAEAAVVEAAALLRFTTSGRSRSVVDHLGSLLDQSGQRLALALLPPADFAALKLALSASGFGALYTEVPVTALLSEPANVSFLTKREQIILAALVRKGSTKQIAAELSVSVNTVKSQLRTLYRKLGVSDRDSAIAVALDRYFVPLPAIDDDPRNS